MLNETFQTVSSVPPYALGRGLTEATLIQAEITRPGTTAPNGVVASEATAGEPTEVAAAEGASPSSSVHRAT